MKRFAGSLILLLCVVLVGSSLAKEQKVYFNLGIAGASASYPTYLENTLDLLDSAPGVEHYTIGVDLTLYFPLRPGALLGFSLNGIGDRYEVNSDYMQINQYLYAASYRYYLSKMVGRGFFVRGDIGLAKMALDATGSSTVTSDSGLGFLVGGGYSWQISGGTWFSLNADFTSKSIEDETVGGVTVGAAFLF